MNCILPLWRVFITTLVNKGIFHNYYNSTEIETYTQKKLPVELRLSKPRERRQAGKTLQWSVLSESPSSCAAKVCSPATR